MLAINLHKLEFCNTTNCFFNFKYLGRQQVLSTSRIVETLPPQLIVSYLIITPQLDLYIISTITSVDLINNYSVSRENSSLSVNKKSSFLADNIP